jgi:hypothetical protein
MKSRILLALTTAIILGTGPAFAIDVGGCICDPWGCGETIPY